MESEELERVARLKGLSLQQAEKDYLQDMVLFSAYSQQGRNLIFKGGTCLYKFYKLNRFSEDLDFTLAKRIDAGKLAETTLSDLALPGIRCRIKEIKEYRNEINIRFLMDGPLFRGTGETQCFIPLNISKREQVLLEPRREPYLSLYRELPQFDIFVMQEKEILAEKVRAILTRRKPRDAYDLWFLLCRREIPLDTALVDKKLARHDTRFELGGFMARVAGMRGMWETDLAPLIRGGVPGFESVSDDIAGNLKKALKR